MFIENIIKIAPQTGHYQGCVGGETIEAPVLAPFLQFQMLFERAEKCLDAPTLAVHADYIFVGKAEVRGKQGQPVSLVLVAYENELGFEDILDLIWALAKILTLSRSLRIWL